MDDPSPIIYSYHLPLVISLIVLLGFSAFFSACEMAFSSLNRIKLKKLAEKSRRARLALKMLETYDKVLSTVLIGNNAVNVAASALATVLLIGIFGTTGVSLATLMMTVILMLFCDISPKVIAKEAPELTALRAAPLLRFFVFILTPINYLTTVWKKFLMIIFPVKIDRSTTQGELLTYVEEVRHGGAININEEQMIRQVIEFDDLKVSGIYTPRIDVASISSGSTIQEIDQKFIETGFSRLPVYQDTIDNITGIILLRDFYQEVMKGTKTFPQIIKPVIFVTKTIKIGKLLKTLQKKQSHMAVVVDEQGGTLGIVTIEDIIEELVGEIWDEHDEVIEPARKEKDGSWIVLGSLNFKDMLEAINAEPKNSEFPDTTVANWIMETLGRLPQTGEILNWNYLILEVLNVVKQRVTEVKVTCTNHINLGYNDGGTQ
ncbi:MAG: hemolysin family protein [Treponema sp.]|jgi:CBS domain containing-hemolysin-like protein|nr:hemolysin family protein [Treponema sp.]